MVLCNLLGTVQTISPPSDSKKLLKCTWSQFNRVTFPFQGAQVKCPGGLDISGWKNPGGAAMRAPSPTPPSTQRRPFTTRALPTLFRNPGPPIGWKGGRTPDETGELPSPLQHLHLVAPSGTVRFLQSTRFSVGLGPFAKLTTRN